MEPYKIYDFEDEKAWLKGRLNGIGGSDASAVVGKNPYKTNIELFEEKTGRRIAPDISEKPYVIYGKEAEQFIRELFRLDYPQYQVAHHEFRILQSLEYPFMQASLDGELVDQDGRKGILEIKTTNILQSMQYEKWKDRIPDENFIKDRYLQMAKGAFLEREKPVTLRIIARYLPPKSVSKKRKLDMLEGRELPLKKPDMDNIVKVVADALNGVAYHDDTQIALVQAKKCYSAVEGLDVTVEEYTG